MPRVVTLEDLQQQHLQILDVLKQRTTEIINNQLILSDNQAVISEQINELRTTLTELKTMLVRLQRTVDELRVLLPEV
jgi:hypothetical protein